MKKRKSYKYKFENIDQLMEAAAEYLAGKIRPQVEYTCASSVKAYYTHALAAKEREEFRVLFLNNRHELIAAEQMFKGTINCCTVVPREIVKRSLELNACAVILGHNHPSGDVEPSRSDKEITKRISEALALIEVRVLDHIIVGGRDSMSFAERGLI